MHYTDLIVWLAIVIVILFLAQEIRAMYSRYTRRPSAYSKNGIWPEPGHYLPKKAASGGMSPEGGMRETPKRPKETPIGHWNGEISQDIHALSSHSIYDDHAGIPDPTVEEVGWWGNPLW